MNIFRFVRTRTEAIKAEGNKRRVSDLSSGVFHLNTVTLLRHNLEIGIKKNRFVRTRTDSTKICNPFLSMLFFILPKNQFQPFAKN